MIFVRQLRATFQFIAGLPARLREGVRHPASVPVAMSVGLVISLIATMAVHSWEQAMTRQKVAEIAQEQVERVQVTGLRSMEILYSLAALFDAQGTIHRSEFGSFVRQGLTRQPELLALEWVPRVADAERVTYETTARTDGVEDFCFREVNAAGLSIPAARRPEYLPVYFVEPRKGNECAVGYDLNSDPLRRQALEQARDSGKPVATAPLHLVQESARQTGLLVLLPVYRGSEPRTVEERREKLAGFAVAVFRVEDLVAGALGEMKRKGIDARLVDELAQEPIYDASALLPAPDKHVFLGRVGFEMAARRWILEFQPNAQFAGAQFGGQWLLVLLGGLSLTLLISVHFQREWKRAREAATANRALQEEIAVRQKAEAAAAAANQAKSDFLASMSHEIRTPLNAILGYTQLMQHDPELSPVQRDAVNGISGSGRHLTGLINEILDLSKIEAGRMELNLMDFDLSGLGRSLVTTFRPLCAQKRIGVRLMAEVSQPIRVHGDEGKLRQILINLLGNAVKFTRAGEVYFSFRPEANDTWLFEVVDTGLGIPEEEQDNIFKPFHQGRNAAHQGGTGLGLAIAQRQVELLGGKLELQSERGIGSRFHFRIPLAPATGEPPADSRATQVPRLKPGQRVPVLVVDDRKDNRDVLAGMLAQAGCEVSVATSGEEALTLARSRHPSMVFLDIIMPGMDGIATARAMLGDAACGQPKIVAHSAAAILRNREQAQAAGCVDFLAKPILADQVHECLRAHLGVEFEFGELGYELEHLPPWEAGQIRLPEELVGRLTTAAELHSTTALKMCLQELNQVRPDGPLLAEHVRQLMRSYDMDGILRLVGRVTSPDLPTPR